MLARERLDKGADRGDTSDVAPRIPRLCDQICIVDGAVPAIVAERRARFLALNPGYTHCLWIKGEIEDAILKWYGRDMLATYLRISPIYPAAQADLFRYLLKYHRGGVYIDCKSEICRPLSTIIRPYDEYLLSRWPNRLLAQGWGRHHDFAQVFGNTEFLQWFIICCPRHPYLAAVIDRVLANIESYDDATAGTGFTRVLRTTGPIPYTLAIYERLHKHSHRMIDIDESGILFRTCSHVDLNFGPHYAQRTEAVVVQLPKYAPPPCDSERLFAIGPFAT